MRVTNADGSQASFVNRGDDPVLTESLQSLISVLQNLDNTLSQNQNPAPGARPAPPALPVTQSKLGQFSQLLSVGQGSSSGLWDVARNYVRGPFQVVGDAAMMLAKKINDSADASTEAARRISQIATSTTGGDTQGAARLVTYGKVAGVDTDSEAQRLHDRVQSGNNLTRMYALQADQDLTPAPFDEQDYGKQYFKAIRTLRDVKDPQERIRRTRALGLQNSQPLIDMSDEMYDRVENQSRTTAIINNPVAQRRAYDEKAARGLAEQSYDNYNTAWGQPWSSARARTDLQDAERYNNQALAEKRAQNEGARNKPLDRWMYNLSEKDAREEAPYLQNDTSAAARKVISRLTAPDASNRPQTDTEKASQIGRRMDEETANRTRLYSGGFGLEMAQRSLHDAGQGSSQIDASRLMRSLHDKSQGLGKMVEMNQARNPDHTAALDRNTAEMHQLGLYMVQKPIGGGERAQNAIPSKLTGRQAFRSYRRGSLHQGAL